MDKKLIRQLLFFSLVVCIIFVASFAYGALQKTGPDSFYDVLQNLLMTSRQLPFRYLALYSHMPEPVLFYQEEVQKE